MSGPYTELITQSGSKHIIKVNTINKILKIAKNKGDNNENNKVSIKDNSGIKIYTTLNKIKEIDMDSIPSSIKFLIFLVILVLLFGGVFYFLKTLEKKPKDKKKKEKKKKTQ